MRSSDVTQLTVTFHFDSKQTWQLTFQRIALIQNARSSMDYWLSIISKLYSSVFEIWQSKHLQFFTGGELLNADERRHLKRSLQVTRCRPVGATGYSAKFKTEGLKASTSFIVIFSLFKINEIVFFYWHLKMEIFLNFYIRSGIDNV